MIIYACRQGAAPCLGELARQWLLTSPIFKGSLSILAQSPAFLILGSSSLVTAPKETRLSPEDWQISAHRTHPEW